MVKSLIVATTRTPEGAAEDIAAGLRPRIDYLDLQARLNADLVDFSIYDRQPYKALERPDRLSRLAWGQALYVMRHWENYDFVYSLCEDVGLSLEYLLRWTARRRPYHIMVAHNILSPRKIPVVRAMNVMNRFGQIIVLASSAACEIATTYDLPPQQVSFLTDAVDERYWQADPAAQSEADFILSVGRARRDYDTLIAAVEPLPVRLRIQAGSEWPVAYKNTVANSMLSANVEFGPSVAYPELRSLYNRAAFIVVPLQRGAHHSAGTSAIKEAMAMSKAVIVTSDGGAVDYVHHNETGLLVPPGDPVLLRKAIVDLLKHPERARRMGQCARALLERDMRYDRKIDRLASLTEAADK